MVSMQIGGRLFNFNLCPSIIPQAMGDCNGSSRIPLNNKKGLNYCGLSLSDSTGFCRNIFWRKRESYFLIKYIILIQIK